MVRVSQKEIDFISREMFRVLDWELYATYGADFGKDRQLIRRTIRDMVSIISNHYVNKRNNDQEA